MPRLLLIDNHDSFTYNVVEDLAHLGVNCTVIANDDPRAGASLDQQQAYLAQFNAIIISPGPGHPANPQDVGLSVAACSTDLPILGICLGHQLLALQAGATIAEVAPNHGIVAEITHTDAACFAGIPRKFAAVRYHSLAVIQPSADVKITATSADGTIMAFEHKHKPWWGVQFHPESIDTTYGRQLLANFLSFAGWKRSYLTNLDSAIAPEDVAGVLEDQNQWMWLEFPEATVLAAADASLRAWQEPALVEYQGQWYSGGIAQWLQPTMLREPRLAGIFQLGWAGYIGYEYRNFTQDAQKVAPVSLDVGRQRTPDVELLRVQRAVVFHSGQVSFVSDQPADPWLDTFKAIKPGSSQKETAAAAKEMAPVHLRCRTSKKSYLAAIVQLRDQLAQGNTYEACLTTALTGQGAVGLEHYLALRAANTSPYAAYWKSHDTQILSASPELFLKVTDGIINSSPMKGTRERAADPAELAANPKDLAENRMIVDLVRNDLTQVAVPGSVQVIEHAAVHTFATVHQLISTIQARQAPQTSLAHVLAATFPGGSMTGAPKQRTMKILEEVEGQPRGIYSGALGWIGAAGDANLSMVIRTLVAHGTQLHYGIGGAVLYASDPEAEYQEIQVKSRAIQAIAQVDFEQ